ncbi:MAG: ChaN family lipoprotein [Ferruginibacter sp.]
MLKAAGNAEVVLFGEQHNSAIAHWLQIELTKGLAQKTSLVLGAEMLEADNQTTLNKYLAGEITKKGLDTTARLWPNFKTDYKPLVDFAKEKKYPFIATNIPRRYASKVFKYGFETLDSLSALEKSWIAPLPILYDSSLPAYVKMLEMGESSGNSGANKKERFPMAQAVKDATMGYFIHKNLQPNTIFVHYNGAYHSDNFEAIGWYLKKQNTNTKIITISTVVQANVSGLEKDNEAKADFIIVVDEDVTTTY